MFLAVLGVCVLLLPGRPTGPNAKAQAEQPDKVKNPYETSSVLIEAFVVEVRLSALYDLGVSPIGQKPHAVSVHDILKCLQDENKARVTAGAKLTACRGDQGNAKSTEGVHVERQALEQTASEPPRVVRPPVRPRGGTSWQIGTEFSASAFVQSDGRIHVSYQFSQNTLRDMPPSENEPVDAISRNWASQLYLNAGEPQIVGAIQNEEKAVFLIISADIQGM